MPDLSRVRKNIARNIVYYRKKLKLTQKELASHLNIKNSSVSNWENEQNSPDIDSLFALCTLFQIDINEMCGFEEQTSRYTQKEQQLITHYRRAADADRIAVEAILGKYATPNQQSAAM